MRKAVLATYWWVMTQADGVRWAVADLPKKLPAGHYHLVCDWSDAERLQASYWLGFGVLPL